MANKQNLTVSNIALIEALRKVIDLPKNVTSLDLSMRMDTVPTVTCTFLPTLSGECLDVSTLDDAVRRWVYVG